MEKLQQFFSNLASRMTDENDLSDFVWALCQSNEGFKQFFIDLFFKSERLRASDFFVEREVFLDSGRPDFVITRISDERDFYFVEVKKSDRKHHFRQYLDELVKAGHGIERLGYITQYTLEPGGLENQDRDVAWANGEWMCPVRTWGDFLASLERCVACYKEHPWAQQKDVFCLLAFVKSSCQIYEPVTSFTLDKNRIDKIRAFAEALDEVIESEVEICGNSVQLKGCYNSRRDYESSLHYIGRYFSMTGLYENTVWGWLGSYFTKEDGTPGITLEFDNNQGWGAPVFRRIKSNKTILDYCETIELTSNKQEMVARVRAALVEMLGVCQMNEPSPTPNWITPDELLDVKRIQLFLEQNILINKNDLPLEFKTDHVPSDDFSAARWVGRYSYITIGEWTRLVWIGVRYDAERILHCGKRERADGSQLILEIGDNRYVICKDFGWNATHIRNRIYEIVCSVKG